MENINPARRTESLEQLRPTLTRQNASAVRVYALDVALSVLLFVHTSVMTGRVWRFPFDDELITLAPIERTHSWLQLTEHYLNGGDIHPPLSFLLFYGLTQAGLSEAQLRLCSLAMTAFALALFTSSRSLWGRSANRYRFRHG